MSISPQLRTLVLPKPCGFIVGATAYLKKSKQYQMFIIHVGHIDKQSCKTGNQKPSMPPLTDDMLDYAHNQQSISVFLNIGSPCWLWRIAARKLTN